MKGLPKFLEKYFWGDNLEELSWESNRRYVTQTILNKGNLQAGRWLVKKVGKSRLSLELPKYKLDPKSANYWKLLLHHE